MYIGYLETDNEIFSLGQTEEEAAKNIVKAYKKIYSKEERSVPSPKTADDLFEYFGGGIYEVKNGYVQRN